MTHRQSLGWRCRRGTRELDLLLMGYLEHAYDQAMPAEQALFSDLLKRPDPELHRILFDPLPSDGQELVSLVAKIRSRLSV